MKKTQDKLNIKKVFKPIKLMATCIIIILSFSIIIYAYSTGSTGRTKKGNTPGCTCHGVNPTAGVIVSINGPDTLAPGQMANYNLTIKGGPLVRAGTDIAVSQGTLVPVSNELQLLNSELTHKSPKAPDSGVVTFEFTYTAPLDTGEQTIYASGNSVNFDNNFTGDEWNYAPNKTILVIGTPTDVKINVEIPGNFQLMQNYPNPFNPTTTISYQLPVGGHVTLKVYDILGNEVATLINENREAGYYQTEFNGSSLSSGMYIYKLTAGNFISTRKMLMIK